MREPRGELTLLSKQRFGSHIQGGSGTLLQTGQLEEHPDTLLRILFGFGEEGGIDEDALRLDPFLLEQRTKAVAGQVVHGSKLFLLHLPAGIATGDDGDAPPTALAVNLRATDSVPELLQELLGKRHQARPKLDDEQWPNDVSLDRDRERQPGLGRAELDVPVCCQLNLVGYEDGVDPRIRILITLQQQNQPSVPVSIHRSRSPNLPGFNPKRPLDLFRPRVTALQGAAQAAQQPVRTFTHSPSPVAPRGPRTIRSMLSRSMVDACTGSERPSNAICIFSKIAFFRATIVCRERRSWAATSWSDIFSSFRWRISRSWSV